MNLLNVQETPGTSRVMRAVWEAPPSGFIKLKVDASFETATNLLANLGVVARDAVGAIIFSATSRLSSISSSLYAKVLAIKWGLELADRFEVRKILLESDSLLAVKEITRDRETF
ncbi:hypothetical protein REPUB_Repub02eG0111700 [Reevesia pubescens]